MARKRVNNMKRLIIVFAAVIISCNSHANDLFIRVNKSESMVTIAFQNDNKCTLKADNKLISHFLDALYAHDSLGRMRISTISIEHHKVINGTSELVDLELDENYKDFAECRCDAPMDSITVLSKKDSITKDSMTYIMYCNQIKVIHNRKVCLLHDYGQVTSRAFNIWRAIRSKYSNCRFGCEMKYRPFIYSDLCQNNKWRPSFEEDEITAIIGNILILDNLT